MTRKPIAPFMATNIISGEVRCYDDTTQANEHGFSRAGIRQCLVGKSSHHLGWRFTYQPAPIQTTIPGVTVTLENPINNTFQVNNGDGEWMFKGTFEECSNFLAGSLTNKYMIQSLVRKFHIVRIP